MGDNLRNVWLELSIILEQVALNKSSLLLTIILPNTQILQLFAKIIKPKVHTKVIKMQS